MRSSVESRSNRSVGFSYRVLSACSIVALVLGASGTHGGVDIDAHIDETSGGRVGMMVQSEVSKAEPQSKPKSKPQSKPRAKPQSKPRSKPMSQPKSKPASKPRSQPAAKPRSQPKPKPKPKAKPRPQPKPKAKPKPRPSSKPKTQPARQPSRQPVTKPSTRPSTQPSTRPTKQPTRKPAVRPSVQPKPKTVLNPGRKTVEPNGLTQDPGKGSNGSNGSSKTASKQSGPVSKGVRRPKGDGDVDRAGGLTRPVAFEENVPRGFDIVMTKNRYLSKAGSGGKSGKGDPGDGQDTGPTDQGTSSGGTGNGVVGIDQGGVETKNEDGGHDSGDHHDDGHHGDDHHDDHHGDVYIDIDIYTNSHGCPNGWWYVYGDYDGDGYTDYVCTNGVRSVYWYGWSGDFWNCSPWYGWYGSRYSYSWWYYSVPDRYRGPIYGQGGDLTDDPEYSVVPEYVEEVPEAMPLSAVEVARLEMAIGNPEIAIEAYRAHLLDYPDDWGAVRELGCAMIREHNRGDGVAMVSYAYAMDPGLAYEPLQMSLFEDSTREMRDAVIDVVGWGHRNPSASVWLTVAALMQGEGRDGPAKRMIERARGYGLDREIDDLMMGALNTP